MVHPICQQNLVGSELQAQLLELKNGLQYPVVAMGLLCWISANLLDQNYYATNYSTITINIHLNLLNEVYN